MRILVVNPNTTLSMTNKIAAAARSVAAAGTEIVERTSKMGPASIEGYFDEAISLPGLLAEIADAGDIDAAIIACFDDTGLDAARALAPFPVLGICEVGVSTASFLAQRLAVVTTMERSRVPIQHLVQRYGMASRCEVFAADIPVLPLEEPASGAIEKLRHHVRLALEGRAEAIVLGCAGMADLAHELQEEFGVPVIDGVTAAVKQAEGLVTLGLKTSKRGAYASPIAKAYSGAMEIFALPRAAE